MTSLNSHTTTPKARILAAKPYQVFFTLAPKTQAGLIATKTPLENRSCSRQYPDEDFVTKVPLEYFPFSRQHPGKEFCHKGTAI